MSYPGGPDPSGGEQVFRFTNPARSVTVTTAYDGHAIDITVTPAALAVSEAELSAEILAAAKFSRDRSRAAVANERVANSVAGGDDEGECRRYIHKVQNMPTDDDVAAEIAQHYGLSAEQADLSSRAR